MRVSVLLCASVAAFAAWSAWDGARAAMPSPSPSASRQAPKLYRLPAGDTAAEKACNKKGGSVSTDLDGNRMCKMPLPCPAAKPGALKSTTKLDAKDPGAAKKCTDACGVVSTDAAGAQVCTKQKA